MEIRSLHAEPLQLSTRPRREGRVELRLPADPLMLTKPIAEPLQSAPPWGSPPPLSLSCLSTVKEYSLM